MGTSAVCFIGERKTPLVRKHLTRERLKEDNLDDYQNKKISLIMSKKQEKGEERILHLEKEKDRIVSGIDMYAEIPEINTGLIEDSDPRELVNKSLMKALYDFLGARKS